jgi:hypothetical protein
MHEAYLQLSTFQVIKAVCNSESMSSQQIDIQREGKKDKKSSVSYHLASPLGCTSGPEGLIPTTSTSLLPNLTNAMDFASPYSISKYDSTDPLSGSTQHMSDEYVP